MADEYKKQLAVARRHAKENPDVPSEFDAVLDDRDMLYQTLEQIAEQSIDHRAADLAHAVITRSSK